MFKNVIVGVDGNEGGRDAIALARVLLADGGELTFGYVYHGDPHVWRGPSLAYEAPARDRARGLLEQAREDAGVEAQLRGRRSPSAGRGLHELAEACGSDLLVIGSSRHGLLGRVLVGDDTRASLNGASCAVAIAPAGYSRTTVAMREIGVAYNGTGESEHALSVARRLAAQHGTKLSAFEAVSLPTYAFIGGPGPVDGVLDDLVAAARERIAALGGVEPHAAYGTPAEELALYSASTDLLIVGSRDYGPIGRIVHGSTSQQLARSARCPLLVLTRAARNADMPEASAHDHQASVPASP